MQIVGEACKVEMDRAERQWQLRRQAEAAHLRTLQLRESQLVKELGQARGEQLAGLQLQELEELNNQLLASMSRVTSARQQALANARDSTLCKVCIAEPLQVALMPCGHHCLCLACSHRLEVCPICRVTIQHRQQLFTS
jgi:hypothetical protein